MGLKKIIAAAMTAGIMLSFIPANTLADSTGWVKDGDNWKYYTYEDGFIRDDWKSVDGSWYYFNHDGIMLAGIENIKIGSRYYSFSDNGACKNPSGMKMRLTGWFRECDLTYYKIMDGKYNIGYRTVGKYTYYWTYRENGTAYEGWKTINGKTYYFLKNGGHMLTGRQYYVCENGNYFFVDPYNATNYIGREEAIYYFSDSGSMMTGWIKDGKNWYYAGSDGKLLKSQWLDLNGKWYYFDDQYCLVTNVDKFVIKGIVYSFDHNGVCKNPDAVKSSEPYHGWYKMADSYGRYEWFYYDENGKKAYDWKKIGNSWYCFSRYDGSLYADLLSISKDYTAYYFKPSGEMLTGWYHVVNDVYDYWCYADATGKVCYDQWRQINGKWYYFARGRMLADVENYTINGIDYSFDASGACLNPYAKAQTITGWHKRFVDQDGRDYAWYYYDAQGNEYTEKWLNWNGTWYYFDSQGEMVQSKLIRLDGKFYDFDCNGVCLNPYNGRDTDISQEW